MNLRISPCACPAAHVSTFPPGRREPHRAPTPPLGNCSAACVADALKQALKKPAAAPPDPGFCEDTDQRCGGWAAAGECSNNPTFMVGGQFTHGACRHACAECEPCASHTLPCYAANRERAGFLNLFDEIRTLTSH